MTGITESEIERLLEEPGEAVPRMSGKLVRDNGGDVPGAVPDDVPRFSGKLLNRNKPAPKGTATDSQGRPLKKGTWVTLRHDKRSRRMKFLGTVEGANGSIALRFASINGKEIKHPIPQALVSSKPDLVTPIARPDAARDEPAPQAAPAPQQAPQEAPAQPAPAAAPAASQAAPQQAPQRNLNDMLASEQKRKAKAKKKSAFNFADTDTGFTDSHGNPIHTGQTVYANGKPATVIGKMGKQWLRTNFDDGKGLLWTQEEIDADPNALVPHAPEDDAGAAQEAPDAQQAPEAPVEPEAAPEAPEAPQAAPQAAPQQPADDPAQAAPATPPQNPPNSPPSNGGDPVRVDGLPGPVYANVDTNYYVHWNPSTHSFAVTKGYTVNGKFTPQQSEKITNAQAQDLINKYGNEQGKARAKQIGQPHFGPSEFGEAVKLIIPALNESMVDPSTFECMTGPKTKIKRRKKVSS